MKNDTKLGGENGERGPSEIARTEGKSRYPFGPRKGDGPATHTTRTMDPARKDE